MSLWWVMLASGLLTFAIRLSFIVAEGRYAPPSWFRAMLPFVPVAVLAAIIVPDLVMMEGVATLDFSNRRLVAGTAAIAIAAATRSVPLTIGGGFLVLFLLRVSA